MMDVMDMPGLTESDRQNLLAGDEKFTPHTWNELKQIIAENNISILTRWPSDLQRYLEWTHETKAKYGTISDFVCQERLHWQPLSSSTSDTGPIFATESDQPFESTKDFKILVNDWPYGLDKDITHIVVWLKMRIAVQPPDGYLLPESRTLLEDFVDKTFIQTLKDNKIDAEDRVQWFKNWAGLQSIRGLEHFHVLVRDVPQRIIEDWTSDR